MPLYEYTCLKCRGEFEKIVPGADSPVSCPTCRSRRVEKQFSLFGTKSGGKFKSSRGGSECGSCTATSCKSCT